LKAEGITTAAWSCGEIIVVSKNIMRTIDAYLHRVNTMTSRQGTDWVAIRTSYEQGRLSNRELARRYAPLTEGAVRKRAKKEGWSRPERARTARPSPIVRRAERPRWKLWRHHERIAPPIIIDHHDPKKPSPGGAEDAVGLGESGLAILLDQHIIKLQNRELLIEMLEHCAAEYHVPYHVFVKLRQQFEMPSLVRELRTLAETLKIFASIRERSARSHRRG
jgi:hypothetical protein